MKNKYKPVIKKNNPISKSKRILLILLFIIGFTQSQQAQEVTLTATAGNLAGSFNTLKQAFDAINTGRHNGNIVININANTIEGTTPAVLNSNNADPASYISIIIRPTVNGLTITGNPAAGFGVIELNGADNVTIDGDNPNVGGTNRNLTVNNTNTNTATGNSCIRIATSAIVNSADNITIKNCILNGNVTSGNAGGITSTTSSSNISFGIYCGGNGGATAITAPTAITSETTNPAISGTTINGLVLNNNAINQCARGIAINGAASPCKRKAQLGRRPAKQTKRRVRMDRGYSGLDKAGSPEKSEYGSLPGIEVLAAIKGCGQVKVTALGKAWNQVMVSPQRMQVEQNIGHLKNWRVLSGLFRAAPERHESTFAVVAGLHNFRILGSLDWGS